MITSTDTNIEEGNASKTSGKGSGGNPDIGDYESQPSDYDGYICNKDTGIIHLPTCTTLPEVKKEMDKVFQEFMVLSGIDPATMMLKSNEQFFRTLTSG